MKKRYLERIHFSGNLDDLAIIICKDFDLGTFQEIKIIPYGYEDLNCRITTNRETFFVKIFSDFRSLQDCQNIVKIMEKSLNAGVSLPRLFASEHGYFHQIEIGGARVRLVVTEFIDGKDFLRTREDPTKEDIQFLAHQAALINSLKINSKPIYDHWAIQNLPGEFEKKKKVLLPQERTLIQSIANQIRDYRKLPECFVHGDIIRSNVIKSGKKLWIVDFSVANRYPRIVELAVLAADVCLRTSKKETEKNVLLAVNEYEKTIPLSREEHEALPLFANGQHAQHVLQGLYEREVLGNTSYENDYHIESGRKGLHHMIS